MFLRFKSQKGHKLTSGSVVR